MKPVTLIIALAGLVSANGQQFDAIDSLNRLLKTDLDPKQRAYVLDELSYIWFTQDLDTSLYYGQESYLVFSELDDLKGLSQAATSVAAAYHYLNQWDSAEWYYQQALGIRRSIGDTAKVASSLNNLGVLFMDRDEYDKSANYFVQSLEVREQVGDTLGAALTRSNLGLIFKKQGNYDKAIDYYLEAKETLQHSRRLYNFEVALLNLGSIYNTIGDYKRGLQYNSELKDMATRRSSYRNLAKSYVNLSNSFQGLGRLDSSIYYVNRALEFFEESNDTLNIARSLLSIAQFHNERGEHNQAVRYANQLTRLNTTLDNRELLVDNELVIAEAYAGQGNFGRAYQSLRTSYEQKDSLLTESLNATIADLSIKYETEQKEREISELKVKNQEVELARQRSANQRNVFLLVATIFIVGAILLFLLLRTKSRANAIISNSLTEKETLLKEIHHRVKNNLQVISSLLSLQSRYIEDEAAQEAVNEGQNRVKSMALIHQKLYQRDNLLGVEAMEYVQNLTTELRAAYGIDPEKVAIDYDVASLNLDVDTLIPIGLILNELISNSFKHAFPEERKGNLFIGLKEVEDQLELKVKDDGVGSNKDVSQSDSFGMRMIHSLAMKLEATVNFNFSSGAEASLLISSYKLV